MTNDKAQIIMLDEPMEYMTIEGKATHIGWEVYPHVKRRIVQFDPPHPHVNPCYLFDHDWEKIILGENDVTPE